MAAISDNQLTITLTEYVVSVMKRSVGLVEREAWQEVMNCHFYLTKCDKTIVSRLARKTLGLPYLTKDYVVSYAPVKTRVYVLDTAYINEFGTIL